ncbi:MAG TPA: IS200/IS605 family transposase [Chthonomonadaceae bacterium]|nr:IS200/IS605 family transposase [Chthonomonadaceae bacterium]
MPNSHTEVYVHFVWATWDRKPLITPELEPQLCACIRARCRDMQTHLFAIGGIADHIHLLVRLPATFSLSQIAKDIKGASSHLVTHMLGHPDFRWQGAYSAHGVADDRLDIVGKYIENQKVHHAQNTTYNAWELPDDADDENSF